MSTYVMSDLHGQYKAYLKMLELIEFSDDDVLYVLGDVIDRGPEPISIVLDLMERTNVEVLVGNHELMMCESCKFLMKEITDDNINRIDYNSLESFINWQVNGANTTLNQFHKLDSKKREAVLDFIMDLEIYAELTVNDRDYILVHAGLADFQPDKELWEYDIFDLVWRRPDYSKAYYDDKYVITGHTPTIVIDGAKPGYIYKANNHIAIDCGVNIPGGRLGCIRLDDMKEFYVKADI